MPLDPVTGTIIASGISAAGSGANAFATGKMNKKNRRFAYQMYKKQYGDNIRLWEMQNKYNSPQEQMKRFQDAGLNPRLMYGKGTAGAGNAGSIQSADRPTMDYKPVNYGDALTSAVGTYYNTRQQKAQTNLLEKQADATQMKSLLDGAKAATENYGLKNLLPAQLQALEAKTQETLTDTDYKAQSYGWKIDHEVNLLMNQVEEVASRTELNRINSELKEQESRLWKEWKLRKEDVAWPSIMKSVIKGVSPRLLKMLKGAKTTKRIK